MSEDIWKNLADCTAQYDEAQKLARQYSRNETAALNKLNEAQKAVDKFVTEQRNSAPNETDWKRSKWRDVEIAP